MDLFPSLARLAAAPAHPARALARDPEFFAYLLKLIYLPAADSGIVEPEVEDEEKAQNLASQAFQVLHDWALVPGAHDQGVIDPVALEDWVKRARKLLCPRGTRRNRRHQNRGNPVRCYSRAGSAVAPKTGSRDHRIGPQPRLGDAGL